MEVKKDRAKARKYQKELERGLSKYRDELAKVLKESVSKRAVKNKG